jgi:uncharacterized protein (TIGR03083 family)
MPSPLDALEVSVDHLRTITVPMEESQYVASAYPTEWTVADVMSHLGSGAIISKRRIDDSLDERETPSEFNQSVWDVWNAKTPHAQVTDALDADRALLARLLEMTPDERARYSLSLGPMTFDFDGVVRLRLGEHAVHTWDIEESLDAQATLQPEAVPFLIDNLGLLLKFSAKSINDGHTLHIRTTEPNRELTLTQSADGVTLVEAEGVDAFDLELPAEAFVRLAYGRLDDQHTPAGVDTAHLDELRRVFPGM